jgi:hypothetical protein
MTHINSCVCALRNDEQECKRWLQQAVADCPQLKADDIAEDEDLTQMRSKEWFIALVAAAAEAEEAHEDETGHEDDDDDADADAIPAGDVTHKSGTEEVTDVDVDAQIAGDTPPSPPSASDA